MHESRRELLEHPGRHHPAAARALRLHPASNRVVRSRWVPDGPRGVEHPGFCQDPQHPEWPHHDWVGSPRPGRPSRETRSPGPGRLPCHRRRNVRLRPRGRNSLVTGAVDSSFGVAGRLESMDVLKITPRGYCHGVVEAPGKVHLVQDPEDVDALDIKNDRIAVTCQTTLSIWDTAAMIKRVRDKYPQTEAYNEICRATQDRQEAAVEAAKDCDVVIVVGSERSSNSKRLVQVVQELAHKPAYLVDTASDIKPEWLQGKQRVGVTSGASTPTQLTRQVIEYL